MFGDVVFNDAVSLRLDTPRKAVWQLSCRAGLMLLLVSSTLSAAGIERSCWQLPDPSSGTREFCLIVEPKGVVVGEEITFAATVSPPLQGVEYRFRFAGEQNPSSISPRVTRVFDRPVDSTVSLAFYDRGQLIVETGSVGFYAFADVPATTPTQPQALSQRANNPPAQGDTQSPTENGPRTQSDPVPRTRSTPVNQPGPVPGASDPDANPIPVLPPQGAGGEPMSPPGTDARPDNPNPGTDSALQSDDSAPGTNTNPDMENTTDTNPSPGWLLRVLAISLLIILVLLALWLLRGWYYIRRLLYHRDRKHWSKMYRIIDRMPKSVTKRALVRQQHAFALNRDGRGEEAEKLLRSLQQTDGLSPETNGILGRVYKDRWEQALASGETKQTAELLNLAITTYVAGHNSDPGNPYPGVNAMTLAQFLEQRPPWYDDLQKQVAATVLLYRDIRHSYWKYATRLELAVLADKAQEARAALSKAIDTAPVPWQIETTLNNLRLIRVARSQNDQSPPEWLGEIEVKLETAMTRLAVDYQ